MQESYVCLNKSPRIQSPHNTESDTYFSPFFVSLSLTPKNSTKTVTPKYCHHNNNKYTEGIRQSHRWYHINIPTVLKGITYKER